MLFFKECKKVIFSLAFVIYFITLLGFYFTQFNEDCREPLKKPVAGLDDYGTIVKEVPEILMPEAIDSIVGEYLENNFSAYPYGFYKNIRLKGKKRARMAKIISEVSGISQSELDSFEGYEKGGYVPDENGSVTYIEPVKPQINIPETLTYRHFRELMSEADKIIGGGSKYSDKEIVYNFSRVGKTYEDALAEYEQFINNDKITGAYARLFCDYLGLILSILPVFAAVSLANLDNRSRMEQLVFSRKISSAKLFFTRYFSLVTVLLIPVILTAVFAYLRVKKVYADNTLDSMAIFKYTLFWLVPDLMIVSAIGMFFTEISSGLIAIFLQGAWWFASVMSATGSLTGNIGKFTLVIRHNSLNEYNVFNASIGDFAFNRVFYAVVSVLVIALTAAIYEMKRKGVYNGFSLRMQNCKNKSKA